jgi:hypothetical protein
MPKDDKQDQKKSNNSPERQLGEHGYQFFVDNPAGHYQFMVPGTNTGSSTINGASTSTGLGGASSRSASATTSSSMPPTSAPAPVAANSASSSRPSPSSKSSPLSFPSATAAVSPPGSTDRHITDRYGAVIVYPLWQLLPSSVTYPNGTQATFEYDANDDACQITEIPGVIWRCTEQTKGGFSKWTRSDGKFGKMKVTVFPDGNYQMMLDGGNVYTFTTAGRRFLSRPFKPGFDLTQSVSRVFKQLQNGADGLTKEQLNQGVLKNWPSEDDAQLVAMLKMHFELIQMLRDNALLKLGKGISIEDVHDYNRRMASNSSPYPTQEHLKTVEQLFDAIDTDGDCNVTLSEIKQKITTQSLDASQKKSLNYLITHTEKLHTYTARGYVDRTERMTKDEFLAHYKEVYREEIGKFNNAGGWGIEKVWRATMEAKRSLFADSNNPLLSIRVEAIKQGRVGDCLFLSALASIITVRPELILRCITNNGNETYTVTFPGAPDIPIAVPTPTSSELALYAKGSPYGIWAPLMEKAYGMLIAKRRNSPALIPAENTATRANMKSLEILTGNGSRWEYTQDSASGALGMCKRSITPDQLRNLLSNCFAQRRAIIAAALRGAEVDGKEPAIAPGHAYSIIGWDAQNDLIKIRNPWGIVPLNTSQTALLGFSAGKELKDDGSNGIFTLPLISFYKKFEGLCIEAAAK